MKRTVAGAIATLAGIGLSPIASQSAAADIYDDSGFGGCNGNFHCYQITPESGTQSQSWDNTYSCAGNTVSYRTTANVTYTGGTSLLVNSVSIRNLTASSFINGFPSIYSPSDQKPARNINPGAVQTFSFGKNISINPDSHQATIEVHAWVGADYCTDYRTMLFRSGK